MVGARDIDGEMRPSRGIQNQRRDFLNAPVFDSDAHCPLRAGLANAPTLQIAGIDNPRITVDNFSGVNVAESPIIVAEALQIIDRTWRIRRFATKAGSSSRKNSCLCRPSTIALAAMVLVILDFTKTNPALLIFGVGAAGFFFLH